MQDITTEEFTQVFGLGGVNLTCSCWYYNSYAYDLTFQATGLKQIDFNNYSIVGEITDVDDSFLADTLKSRIVPKNLLSVSLVYNLTNMSMRFSSRIAGLVIKPDDDGSDGWAKVLRLIGKMAIATQ